MKLPWPAAAALLLLPGFVLSQSLGEIAEQERAKRKKTGAKAYTNDDLTQGKPTPSPSPSPSAQPTPSPSPGYKVRFKTPPAPGQPQPPGARPEAAGGETRPPIREVREEAEETKEPKPKAPEKTEEYWRGQFQARQTAVAAAEKQVAEAQAKLDGVRQGQVQPLPIDAMTQQPPVPSVQGEDYAKLKQELAAANSALDAAKKSLADLEEEARRAGVPAGWVR